MPALSLTLAALTWSDYAAIVLYMAGVAAIGLWFSSGKDDTEAYLLGDRDVAWWLVAASYVVSLVSTLTMVGVPGEAYAHGVTMALGSLALPIFSIITFHLFVRFYFVGRMFTPFDYLERRFSPSIRALAAGFFWLSRAIYLGLVLYASAKVFIGAANWPTWLTILLVGGVGTAYIMLGGFKAVIWSEFVQFLVMAGGIALILIYALADVPGGAVGVITYAWEHGRGMPELADPSFYSLSPMMRLTLWGLLIAILNEQLFFNSSDQIALQRLLSTSTYQQAKRSLYTSMLLLTPMLLLLWFMGLAIFSYYGQQPAELRPTQGDLALFQFIAARLPAPVPGLIISAMLAAIMSTLNSGINSLATVATKDFYLRFFRPDASESRQVVFSRVMTVVCGGLAILIGLALNQTSQRTGATVMETAMAWLTLSVALPPVFLLGMFSRRATAREALVQLVIGWSVTAAMLAWYLLSQNHPGGGLSFVAVGVPGPVLALLAGWLMSRMRPRMPDAQLRELTYWTLTRTAPEAVAEVPAGRQSAPAAQP